MFLSRIGLAEEKWFKILFLNRALIFVNTLTAVYFNQPQDGGSNFTNLV
jgi:hypothetical protein